MKKTDVISPPIFPLSEFEVHMDKRGRFRVPTNIFSCLESDSPTLYGVRHDKLIRFYPQKPGIDEDYLLEFQIDGAQRIMLPMLMREDFQEVPLILKSNASHFVLCTNDLYQTLFVLPTPTAETL